MAGDDSSETAPAWWPSGGINRPPSPPKWWPEGGINPVRSGEGTDSGALTPSDHPTQDEIVHDKYEGTPGSPSSKRRTSIDNPLGAPVVERHSAEKKDKSKEKQPTGFDPLTNLSDAWRFISGDDLGDDLHDAFGEDGGADKLTEAVDRRVDGDTMPSQGTWGDDVLRRADSGTSTASKLHSACRSGTPRRSNTPRSHKPPAPPTKIQTEAARKTAIQKKGSGWADAHKAASNVLRLLAREMKPLGLEGAATFDPLSGLMLYREHKRFAAARKRAVKELYRDTVDDEFGTRGRGRDHEESNPQEPLQPSCSYEHLDAQRHVHPEKLIEKQKINETLPKLRLGARHAAAAYGSLAAILENNSVKEKAHGLVGAVRDAIVSGGDGDIGERRATEAAAKSAKIRKEDIIKADWVTLPFSPASYVAVDRVGKMIVLAIRGTVSTGDLLTDAVSTSTPFLGGWAHSGMVMSAYQVCKTMVPNAAAALVDFPGYDFLVAGHSMGAGVGAILTMLIHSGDADVLAAAELAAVSAAKKLSNGDEALTKQKAHAAMAKLKSVRCHCFAAPSVCSLDLSLKAREHTVSVVAGKDLIPRLCYAAVRRLLRRLNAAAPSQPVMRAIAAALGGGEKTATDVSDKDTNVSDKDTTPSDVSNASAVPQGVCSSGTRVTSSSESRCQGNWDDVQTNRGLELRDHHASDFLTQPGLVIHLRHLTDLNGPTAEFKHPTAFSEIPISTRMMADHVPMVYQSAIDGAIDRRAREDEVEKEQALQFSQEVAQYGPGGRVEFDDAAEFIEISNREREELRRLSRRRRWKERKILLGAMRGTTTATAQGNEETEKNGAASASTPSSVSPPEKESPNDSLCQQSPGERLWANVRRTLGVGAVGGRDDTYEQIVRKDRDVGDDTSDSSSDDTSNSENSEDDGEKSPKTSPPTTKTKPDSDQWSDDDEADLLAVVAEMLGLDVSSASQPNQSANQTSQKPTEKDDGLRTRHLVSHKRQPSWGLGRLSRLVSKLKSDADAMFTGEGGDGGTEDAFEVDGYVAQAVRDGGSN